MPETEALARTHLFVLKYTLVCAQTITFSESIHTQYFITGNSNILYRAPVTHTKTPYNNSFKLHFD